MPTVSWSELILLLTTAGSTLRWWVERRDARSELKRATASAEAAVTASKDTIAEKNEEIEDIKEDRDFWRSRAEHLEAIVYAGGVR